VSALTAIGAFPIALWEFSLGVWPVVKRFKPSPITMEGFPPASRKEMIMAPSEAVHGPRSLPSDRFSLGQLDRHRSVRQLNRLFSLCLRPVARRLFYLPGLAGRRGLGRAFDIGAALIEPERRVSVCHQRYIDQQPVAPPIDSKCQVKKGQADSA
jgi:hypothetical protein